MTWVHPQGTQKRYNACFEFDRHRQSMARNLRSQGKLQVLLNVKLARFGFKQTFKEQFSIMFKVLIYFIKISFVNQEIFHASSDFSYKQRRSKNIIKTKLGGSYPEEDPR